MGHETAAAIAAMSEATREAAEASAATNLAQALAGLRAGELGWSAFERAARKDFRRLARYLLARSACPLGVDEDDVAQELLAHAAHYIPRWDPNRGVDLHRFVVWNACTRAKRWLMRQTREKAVASSALSRRERERALPEPVAPARQLEDAAAMARLRKVLRKLDPEDRFCVWALAREGSLSAAARVVYGEPKVALLLNVGSEREALTAVRRAAERAAEVAEAV